MSGDGWEDLLGELDDDQVDDDDTEWGIKRALDVGTTLVGYWRGQDEVTGDYGTDPVYLMTDEAGPFFFYGGRAQLDRKIKAAAPNVGDRVAVRRLEDAPAEEGQYGAWRVRVAVRAGDGTVPVTPTENSEVVEEADDGIPF